MDEAPNRGGRPRSEQARTAVLHAVDDLLLETGYAAMTLKGIAERARVSRQTLYRWWSTKAEILFEASATDAQQELAIEPTGTTSDDLTAYIDALLRFLTHSPAGAAYRALLGEAQHDAAVAQLLASKDVLGDSAWSVIAAAGVTDASLAGRELATSLLVGPVLFWVMSGRDPRLLDPSELAGSFMRAIQTQH